MTDILDPGSRQASRGNVLAAISNEVVRLHARRYGRGPTRARTFWIEDVVVVRMHEPFTTAERTLIEVGRVEPVRAMREAFHQELGGELAAIVERLTGQRVLTFVSEVTVDPDLAVDVFFLDGGGPSPPAAADAG